MSKHFTKKIVYSTQKAFESDVIAHADSYGNNDFASNANFSSALKKIIDDKYPMYYWICFLAYNKKIFTHGQYFGGGATWNEIEDKPEILDELLNGKSGGDWYVNGYLTVGSESYFNGEVYAYDGLTVSRGNLNVYNDATIYKDLSVDGDTTIDGKLVVKGTITGKSGVSWYSQGSLKNIVSEGHLTWSDLNKIKPVRFTWKNDESNRVNLGAIADEIQEVMPEVVNKVNGVLTMDYGISGFIIASSLIKEIKENRDRIEKLEKEIESLKNIVYGND